MRESPLIIVTLHTDTQTREGFQLSYFGHVGGGVDLPSTGSVDTFSRRFFGVVSHPETLGTNYTNNELSTFIFHQATEIHNDEEIVSVAFMLQGLEGDVNCPDILRVYKYDKASGWLYHST